MHFLNYFKLLKLHFLKIMKTATDYQTEIIDNKMDMDYINYLLNSAIRSDSILSKEYQFLCSVAKSFGFTFGEHFNLL